MGERDHREHEWRNPAGSAERERCFKLFQSFFQEDRKESERSIHELFEVSDAERSSPEASGYEKTPRASEGEDKVSHSN